MAGGDNPLILVPAQVNEKGPYEFILDTGASVCLITPELAHDLAVPVIGSKEGMGAGGAVRMSLGRVKSLAVGPARTRDLEVAITDELHRVGAAVGAKIHGDIGYGFLKRYRLTIDYRTNLLSLAANGSPAASGTDLAVPFELASPAKPLILVPVKVNGEGPYPFALDTGTSTTIVSPEVAEKSGIKAREVSEATGGGGKVRLVLARADSLAIGTATLLDVRIAIPDFLPKLSRAAGAKLEGIIGYSFLKEFLVRIDYPRSTLRLVKA